MRDYRKDTILFTHGADLDGIGCAILARHYLKNTDLQVHYCNYNDVNEIIAKTITDFDPLTTEILITDISVNQDVAQQIEAFVAVGGRASLLDHHATALWLNDYAWALVQVEEEYEQSGLDSYKKTSGTSMFHQFLRDEGIVLTYTSEEFSELVRLYDSWTWDALNYQKPKDLNTYLYFLGREKFEENILNKLDQGCVAVLSDAELEIIAQLNTKTQAYIEKKAKRAKICMLSINEVNYAVVISFAEENISELGNYLCKTNLNADFALIANIDSGSFSFRGIKDNIDLGKDVAANYGGGGHARAAGASVGIDRITELLNIYKK